MADSKITALTALTAADPVNDMFPVVDVSDTSMAASGTTKKISVNNILGASGTATLASATITGAATVGTTLGVTGVSTFAAGSQSLPALTTTGDTNTGIFFPAADTFAVTTGGTERYRVDSTGLGIGGSPVNPLTVFAAASAKAPALLLSTVGSPTYGWDFSVDGATNGNLFIRRLVANVKTDVLEFDRANGNVGVGVTPSAWGSGTSVIDLNTGGSAAALSSSGTLSIANNAFFNGTDWKYKNTSTALLYQLISGQHSWFTAASGTAGATVTDFATAKMTLDASGNLLVGTTSQVSGEKFSVNAGSATGVVVKNTGGATYSPLYAWNATTTGDGYFSVFFTETAATFRGSITYNRAGGLVAYNTTSDYRAKDIIGPVSNSGSLIDSLKVYVGKMKGATIERPMLIAHEAQEVAPYAVTGLKDEVDADGKDKYQQMDVSSFVPLLIAEIQSLRARVQTLEAR